MAIDLEKYNKIKKNVERHKTIIARSEGAISQILEKLKDEYDCSSVKEAEEKLEDLSTKQNKLERRFKKLLADFETEWGKYLEENP